MHHETRTTNEPLTIAVLGATGNLGGHYARQALNAGHTLRLLARNPDKLTMADHSAATAIRGDATAVEDVERLLEGADVVVSCVGNPPDRSTHIMKATVDNVLAAAARETTPPRCIFISSIGVGGSSWFIGAILRMITRDKAGWTDYEAADLRIRTETQVPALVVRPYALTDKPGKGRYQVTATSPVHFAKPISRADVAAFLLDATTNTQWHATRSVNVTGV